MQFPVSRIHLTSKCRSVLVQDSVYICCKKWSGQGLFCCILIWISQSTALLTDFVMLINNFLSIAVNKKANDFVLALGYMKVYRDL